MADSSMNILVISDTHGDIGRALEMYERLDAFMHFGLIIHLGDLVSDAHALEPIVSCEVVSVPGNCDGCSSRSFKTLETPAGKILVTHGHTENVKMGCTNLLYLAEEQGCRAACYGHTHVPMNEVVQGIRLINPGSLTHPRGGSKPSCAVIVATEKSLTASLINY